MAGRLLLVAYYFPPLGGAGVQRPLKFVKFLPEFGWRPHVLTVVDDPAYVHDTTLFQDIPAGTSIERVAAGTEFDRLAAFLASWPGVRSGSNWLRRGRRPAAPEQIIMPRLVRYLGIPDAKVGWVLPAYRRARSLIRTEAIDAVYTTSAPFSNHLIGYLLKRHTGLPWVADFRDEWTNNPYRAYPTAFHRWLDRKLEAAVLARADHIIGTSEPIVQMLKAHAPRSTRFSMITNGFEEADIQNARALARPTAEGHFRLVHVGTFYDPHTPDCLFQAIAGLVSEHHIPENKIRLQLIGKVDPQCLNQPFLEYRGYMPHQEALVALVRSDCLLLMMSSQRGKAPYPGKLFEYIALGKPILALLPPDSVAADLIRESRTGIVVPPEDVGAIRSALLQMYNEWQAGRLAVQPDAQVIQRYERRNLTRRLAEILNQITEVT